MFNMVKKRITIPKGTKDCEGIERERTQTHIIDIPETRPTVENIPEATVENIGSSTTQLLKEVPVPIDKKFSHEELSDLMPKGLNYGRCADGSCHEKIKNSNFIENFKTCPGCSSNTVPKTSNFCPTCGKNEPEDQEDKEDYWNDSEIEIGEN